MGVGVRALNAQDRPAPTHEDAERPCAAVEIRRFDFWLGGWNLTSMLLVDPDHDVREDGKAKNHIRIALGSCAVVEEFDGASATDLRGMSVSTYNTRLGRWQQTWVDKSGGYLESTGGPETDGRMILKRSFKASQRTAYQRMVFDHITPESLDCYWERSTDSGATWKLLWHLDYVREVP